MTPLEDGFAADAKAGPELGALYAELSAFVRRFGGEHTQLLVLDHPIFSSALFLDHGHLTPEGNRRLAINLLHELGFRLARAQAPELLIHDEDEDISLVAHPDRGYSDGAAWQARLDRPDGLAVDPRGDSIFVADTGNHVLRRSWGRMDVIETFAGSPQVAGHIDGPALEARLESPRDLAVVRSDMKSPEVDAVFFVDGPRAQRLRRWVAGRVDTVELPRRLGALSNLRTDGDALWFIAKGRELWRLDLATRTFELYLSAAPGGELAALEVTPEGELFVADATGRMFRLKLDAKAATLGTPELVFENRAPQWIPLARNEQYPYDFDQVRFEKVREMHWLPRYEVLLVVDELASKASAHWKRDGLTERLHLRILDFDEKKVYPWIKARPFGDGDFMWNRDAKIHVSTWHEGRFATAADGASVFTVERQRSRVLRFSDGLLGVAKTAANKGRHPSNPINRYANKTGNAALRRFAPQRWRAEAGLRTGIQTGPFTVIMVGSSLTTWVDHIGNYATARRIEIALRRELGLRDGIELDLYHRVQAGANATRLINMINEAIDAGLAPDVILVEVGNWNGKYLKGKSSPAAQGELLDEFADAAARFDAKLVLLNVASMVANKRSGLRSSASDVEVFLERAKTRGILVLDPVAEIMPRLQLEAPWGNQPWGTAQHHAPAWGVDITAKTLAQMLAPELRNFFADRTPAAIRNPEGSTFEGPRLSDALADFTANPPAGLPDFPENYVRVEAQADGLLVFFDLAGLDDPTQAPPSRADLEALVLPVLARVLVTEGQGRRARHVQVTVAKFANYDEYGEGVRDSAKRVYDERLDHDALRDLARRVLATSAEP